MTNMPSENIDEFTMQLLYQVRPKLDPCRGSRIVDGRFIAHIVTHLNLQTIRELITEWDWLLAETLLSTFCFCVVL